MVARHAFHQLVKHIVFVGVNAFEKAGIVRAATFRHTQHIVTTITVRHTLGERYKAIFKDTSGIRIAL